MVARRLRLIILVAALSCLTMLAFAGAGSAASKKGGGAGAVGRLVFSRADSRSICEHLMGGGTWSRNALTAGPQLLPGGIFLMGCSHERLTEAPELLLAYDLRHGRILWTKHLASDQEYVNSEHHLFRFFQTVTPAHGLQSRSVHRFVAAYSMRTGKLEWRSADPSLGYSNYDTHSFGRPIEGPSGSVGSPEEVVLSYLGTTAYEAATGKLLWSTPGTFYSEASGAYVGSGTVVAFGREDNSGDELTGLDPVTGTVRWELHLPAACGTDHAETVGTVEWEFGEHCVLAYDLLTGQPVLSEWFPSSWGRVADGESGILEWGEGKLSFYSLTNLDTPIWSESAGETTPILVGGTHAIVESQAGTFLIDLTDGKIAGHVPGEWSGKFIEGPVEGLVASAAPASAETIMRLDPK